MVADADTGHDLIASLLADTRTLVKIESPTSEQDRVATALDAFGALATQRIGTADEVREDSHGACWSWGTGATRVVVLGHVDTVWPVGTLEEIPFDVRDGVLRGPGTFDMKAGLAIGIHAVAAALRHPTGAGRRIDVLVTTDEETGSTGSRALVEDVVGDADAVLCLEGAAPGGAVKVARKGTSHLTIVAHGRSAHAGLDPESGRNAAVALARVLVDVEQVGAPERGTTVVPSLLSGGTTRNTVPERAEAVLDVRATSLSELQRVRDDLEALVASAPTDGTRLEVLGTIGRPPMEESASAALFARASAVADALGHPPLHGVAVGGGSDANFAAQLGVPTLDGLGAVGGGAHARDEHVDVATLVPRVELVRGLLTADLPG